MILKRSLFGRLILICLLFPAIKQVASGQNSTPQAVNFARIEASIQQGKLDEVEKPLLDYAIAHPKDVRALELLAQVRYQQRRFEEAQSLYHRVLALEPTLIRPKINLARLIYELGHHDRARLLLGEMAATSGGTASQRVDLTRALVLVGEFQKALEVADKLPIVVKNGAALPLRAASYLGLGERHKLMDLMPLIRTAAVSNPQVAAECAILFQKAGMSQEAFDLLRSALPRSPNDFRLLILLGQMETKAGNFAAARRHLNRAAKLKPQTEDSLYSFGMLESAEGNYDAALTNLKQARGLAPHSPTILAELVLNAMRANQPQLALEAANELVQLKPDDPEHLYLLGAASLQNGSLASAQSALERYKQQRPNDPRGCLALGITFAGQHGQQQKAKAEFEECLRLDPTNVEPTYQLGLILKSEGDVKNAIQMFEEVTRRSSQHANAFRDLGGLYLQTGAEMKARSVLERAVALNPKDAETHFLLSRLYNLIGESILARQHLALFQKLKAQK